MVSVYGAVYQCPKCKQQSAVSFTNSKVGYHELACECGYYCQSEWDCVDGQWIETTRTERDWIKEGLVKPAMLQMADNLPDTEKATPCHTGSATPAPEPDAKTLLSGAQSKSLDQARVMSEFVKETNGDTREVFEFLAQFFIRIIVACGARDAKGELFLWAEMIDRSRIFDWTMDEPDQAPFFCFLQDNWPEISRKLSEDLKLKVSGD